METCKTCQTIECIRWGGNRPACSQYVASGQENNDSVSIEEWEQGINDVLETIKGNMK